MIFGQIFCSSRFFQLSKAKEETGFLLLKNKMNQMKLKNTQEKDIPRNNFHLQFYQPYQGTKNLPDFFTNHFNLQNNPSSNYILILMCMKYFHLFFMNYFC